MFLYIRVLLIISLLFSMIGAKDIVSVEVIGLGQTEQDAITDAKRNAVSKGLGTFITTETVIENFMLKYDKINSTSKGFVTSIEILSKKETLDKLIEVKVKASVSADNIFGDKIAMNILLESLGKPRLMVMIDETDYQGKVVVNPISETEISNLLLEQGFDLVDASQVAKIRSSNEAKALVSGDSKAAKIISSRVGAEVLIVGSTQLTSNENQILGDMFSNQVVITLKALNSNTGSIIYTKSISGAYPHIDPYVGGQKAIIKTVSKGVVDKFVVKMLDSFQNSQNNGIDITIMAYGVDSFKKYKEVKNILEGLNGIKSVSKRNWNKSGGYCEFSCKSMVLSMESLSEEIDGKKIKGKKVVVNDFTTSTIDIKVE